MNQKKRKDKVGKDKISLLTYVINNLVIFPNTKDNPNSSTNITFRRVTKEIKKQESKKINK